MTDVDTSAAAIIAAQGYATNPAIWNAPTPEQVRHLLALSGIASQNDASGYCIHCGRDNRGHEGEPCADECPRYWEARGVPHPSYPAAPRPLTEDNRHRLNRAKDMRAAWLAYERLGSTDAECRPADMLADLMHLCAVEGVDFDHELSTATDFFSDEGN